MGITSASPIRDLGPCSVIWDIEGTALELSPTHGGVEFKDDLKTKDINEDGQGDTPVDSVTIGRTVSVVVPMTRSSLAQLIATIKGAALVGTANMHVSNDVGSALFALSKSLTIKPKVNGAVSVVATEWLYIYNAYPLANLDIKWDNSTQKTAKVTFTCFPSQVSGSIGKMWRIGAAA